MLRSDILSMQRQKNKRLVLRAANLLCAFTEGLGLLKKKNKYNYLMIVKKDPVRTEPPEYSKSTVFLVPIFPDTVTLL